MPTDSYYKRIYGKNCWMGYNYSRENYFTVHHIKKRADNGKRTPENLALLTRYAHFDFNNIEFLMPDYAFELNEMFKALNLSKRPPTLEYWKEMNGILTRISCHIKLSRYFKPGFYPCEEMEEYSYVDLSPDYVTIK